MTLNVYKALKIKIKINRLCYENPVLMSAILPIRVVPEFTKKILILILLVAHLPEYFLNFCTVFYYTIKNILYKTSQYFMMVNLY